MEAHLEGSELNPGLWIITEDGEEIGRIICGAATTTAAQAIASFQSAEANLAASSAGDRINAERTRRIIAGKVINGIRVTGRDEDARNLTNLALAAQIRIAGGDVATLTTYRDGDNVDHELTPPQMLALWQQSAAYVSDLYAASWALKAMSPVPADISDNQYWPSV